MNLKQTAFATIALLSLGAMTSAARARDAAPAPAATPAKEAAPQPPQPGGRGGMRGGMQMPYKAAFKAVNPTPEQQSKFDALEKTMMSEMTGLRDAAPEERRGKMQEMSGKFEKDVEALLTAEQLPVYKGTLKKEREKAQRGPMAQLDDLNLTEDQKKKVDPIVKDTMAEMQKLMQDRSGDRQTRMQAMAGIMDSMKSKIRPLLTPEQVKEFDAMQFGRMGGRRPQP